MPKKYYINTSIPYVNAKPHIGHAIEFLYADVVARYRREAGAPVRFVTGVDEHGQKVANTAQERGVNPQAHVDEMSQYFVKALEALHISNDDFMRTSSTKHRETAQEIWKKLIASGDLEKREYEGLYCVGCEEFKTEKDLVGGLCPIHKKPAQIVKEENYFFLLSRYQSQLEQWYASHSDMVIPATRFHEIKNIVEGGLEDISVSRSKENLTWGIPVPGDDTQVMYVWFEALLHYVTAADGQWPADVIIVGKDINRFHSIIFPSMLLAAGMEIPHHIAVHGFITVEGEKMSKSLGNVIDPIELVKKYGVDPVRYFLLREIPFSGDGDFSYTRFEDVYQSELANGLGNLLSRVTNMVEKYFEGNLQPHTIARETDEQQLYTQAIEQYEFHRAIDAINRLIAQSNKTIDDEEPWQLAKTDTKKLKILLEQLLGDLVVIGNLLIPFIPDTAETVLSAVVAEQIQKTPPLFPRLDH